MAFRAEFEFRIKPAIPVARVRVSWGIDSSTCTPTCKGNPNFAPRNFDSDPGTSIPIPTSPATSLAIPRSRNHHEVAFPFYSYSIPFPVILCHSMSFYSVPIFIY